jgi:hypothetical protein
MAAITTLLQGLTGGQARDIASKEMGALRWTANLSATADALTDALPASDAKGLVAPILPDIVGEGAIFAWFGPTGGLAIGWCRCGRTDNCEGKGFCWKGKRDVDAQRAGFCRGWLCRIRPVLDGLAGAPKADLGALAEIANALPDDTVTMRQLARHFTSALRTS